MNFHLFRPGMVGGHCIEPTSLLIHKAQTLVDLKMMFAGCSVNNGMAP